MLKKLITGLKDNIIMFSVKNQLWRRIFLRILENQNTKNIFVDFLLSKSDFVGEHLAEAFTNRIQVKEIGTQNLLNREEWLEKTLKALTKGTKILDAGAGELQYKKFCSHLQYVSQDFGQYDGKGDGHALQMQTWDQTKIDILSDITQIPVPDKSFDSVLCVEVFEHLPDPLSALREFARILRPGGQLVLTAPFCSLTHFSPYHFSSGYNHYYYEKHLTDLGFKINEITSNGNYFEFLAQENRRIETIAKTYCKRDLSKLDQLIINSNLNLLNNLNLVEQGSNEILSFGFHVLATKL